MSSGEGASRATGPVEAGTCDASERWPGGRRRLLSIAFAILMVALAIVFVDFRQMGTAIAGASPAALATLLVLASLDRLAMGAKWFHLARPIEGRPRLRRFVELYYEASFISYGLPTMIGGDLYRAVGLARDCPDSKRVVVASVVMEKVVAVVATLTFAWFGLGVLFLRYDSPAQVSAFGIMALSTAGVAAAIGCSFLGRMHVLAASLLARFRLRKLSKAVEEIFEAFRNYASHRALISMNLLFAVVENALQIGIWSFAAITVGVDVPTLDLIALVAVVHFVRRIVMYVEGMALAEILTVSLYGLIGISPGLGVAAALLAHAAVLTSSVPGAVLLFRGARVVQGERHG